MSAGETAPTPFADRGRWIPLVGMFYPCTKAEPKSKSMVEFPEKANGQDRGGSIVVGHEVYRGGFQQPHATKFAVVVNQAEESKVIARGRTQASAAGDKPGLIQILAGSWGIL